jgi:hypothetical protein
MARRFATRFGVAASVAAVVLSLSAGAVLAGEVTGNGMKSEFSQGRSICRFSGLNDDPSEAFPFGGRVQSYGYTVVRNGLKAMAPSPGFACNPNNGFDD